MKSLKLIILAAAVLTACHPNGLQPDAAKAIRIEAGIARTKMATSGDASAFEPGDQLALYAWINIAASGYFSAILRPGKALFLSVLRGYLAFIAALPLLVLLLGGDVREEPRLGLLESVDVSAMVGENGTRRLHVAYARQLQLEVDSVTFALGLELRDLSAQLFCRLCVLGGFGYLRLERRDLLVSLGDGLLPVDAARLRLVLRRLLLPEVFLGLRLFLRLVAMDHVGNVGVSPGTAPL